MTTKKELIAEGITAESDIIKYSLGGLLYSPAHNPKVSSLIINRKYKYLRSFALCLEDAITDSSLTDAVSQTKLTFTELEQSISNREISENEVPYIFIRVKNPEQIEYIYDKINGSALLKGFIFPKFNEHNAQNYLEAISRINQNADNILYGMPILESSSVSDVRTRITSLSKIKNITDMYKNIIMNIRIGGNDFCSALGVRRKISDTIYDISALSAIIGDIVSVFAGEYVISAPVWDYFSGPDNDNRWSEGLKKETEKDIINGLVGKTAIHPSQLEIINSSLKVSEEDYADAYELLHWKEDKLAVSKGFLGNRMNEMKVHRNWAVKTLIRAAVYGIKSTEKE